jgi:hypothetical protein
MILQENLDLKGKKWQNFRKNWVISFTLCILHFSPNIIRMIKSMGMSRSGHIARMYEREVYATVWSENLKGRNYFEDLCVDGRIILKWVLNKSGAKVCTGLNFVMITHLLLIPPPPILSRPKSVTSLPLA